MHWVRLARLAKGANATAVENELAQSVVEADFSGRSAWDAVVDTLTPSEAVGRKLQSILVMDNCEHVLDGAGEVIADLLAAVPELTVLATSREPIGWIDEQLLPVPPLTQDQALSLFRARAQLTGHAITDGDIGVVGSICRHVHNHPLYIRLAAARLLHQPLPIILRELSGESSDRRLHWSHGSRVGADERHRGIRDVIAWSYDLCGDKEQLLLERLSVFAAGYDADDPDDDAAAAEVGAELEAIIAVCADAPEPGIAADEIEGLLERLTDRSLVTVHRTRTAVRYSLLESLRVFAQQRLRERAEGEWDRLAGRHRRYYRDKVRQASEDWYSPAETEVLDWASAAWDNLQCAIDSSLDDPAEAVLGLEIALGLITVRVSFFRGSLREPRRWVEQTMAAARSPELQPVELQIAAMAATAWITLCQGQHEDAERLLDECVAVCCPDPEGRSQLRADPSVDLGLPPSVELARGAELLLARRDVRALPVLARARERFAAGGDRGGASMSELFEALTACFCGSREQALEIARRHFDNDLRSGAPVSISFAGLSWAIAQTKYGDPNEALLLARTALAKQLAMRDQWGAVWAVHICAWALARLCADARPEPGRRAEKPAAQAIEIARLLGGAATMRRRLGVNIEHLGPFADETDRARDTARKVLGDQVFTAAEAEGAMLRTELDEVARLALGKLSLDRLPVNHPIRRQQPSPWEELSEAEQEVAILAAAGWTNSAIAARRGSSFRTVDAQMAAILHKLMISSREHIITLVPAGHRTRIAREAQRRPHRSSTREPRLR